MGQYFYFRLWVAGVYILDQTLYPHSVAVMARLEMKYRFDDSTMDLRHDFHDDSQTHTHVRYCADLPLLQ